MKIVALTFTTNSKETVNKRSNVSFELAEHHTGNQCILKYYVACLWDILRDGKRLNILRISYLSLFYKLIYAVDRYTYCRPIGHRYRDEYMHNIPNLHHQNLAPHYSNWYILTHSRQPKSRENLNLKLKIICEYFRSQLLLKHFNITHCWIKWSKYNRNTSN